MQIAYAYIIDYINIQHQEINLGSPFYFECKHHNEEFTISRRENKLYVSELFRRKSSKRVDNVTAIVGQNGAGKTNLIHFLLEALCQQNEFYGGFLILCDNHGKTTILNRTFKRIACDFECNIEFQYKNYAAIFYSPIYDFQDHYRGFSRNIFDVSSNFLIEQDFIEDEYFSDSIDPFTYHKLKNIQRQVRFLVSQKHARVINNYIPIPREIDVVFINPKLTHDSKNLDNVSYEFRDYYQIGVEIWRKEKDRLHQENYKTQDSTIKRLISKRMARLDILFYVWKFIFYTQEKNNSTLREGRVAFDEKDKEEIANLSLELYIRKFLSYQNIFDQVTISAFINSIDLLVKRIRSVDEGSGAIRLRCNLNEVEDLLEKYDMMIDKLSDLLFGKRPNGLLQFNWRSMSSGERAFLDLFARIYHGISQIAQKLEKDIEFKNPRYIYLFFDEGEAGFHLQWQKEYVKTLLDILPKMFRFKKQIFPHIQLIFTTHSPISLSDIPSYSTVYLAHDSEQAMKVLDDINRPKNSFGANVHEIMYDAFYLRNGFNGKFSKDIIDELFAWSNNQEPNLSTKYVRKAINLVDDPILRVKLEELYAIKTGQNSEEAILQAKIKLMEERLLHIRRENDSNFEQ